MEPCKRLDMTNADYAFAMKCCSKLTESEMEYKTVEQLIKQLWDSSLDNHALVTLSVRTAFDATLKVLETKYPPGTEVLLSAINIPHMVRIIEAHGFVPVPIDVTLAGLEPRMDLLNSVVSPKSKILLVSHLFGSMFHMDAIVSWAKDHDIFLVEDCAEAYMGPQFSGHPESDLRLFSFGTIKTETALACAVSMFRDPQICTNVEKIVQSYPIRPRSMFLKRVMKYWAFSPILNNPTRYGMFVKATQAVQRDHLEFLLSNTRGFPGDLFESIHMRPCLAELLLLFRKLSNFNPEKLVQRAANGRLATELALRIHNVQIPGTSTPCHTFWLYPVVVNDPQSVSKALLAQGFDAPCTTTSLCCVTTVSTVSRDICAEQVYSPETAMYLMNHVLYLPLDHITSPATIIRMMTALDIAVNGRETSSIPKSKITELLIPQSLVIPNMDEANNDESQADSNVPVVELDSAFETDAELNKLPLQVPIDVAIANFKKEHIVKSNL